jgi:hypothetical protein
MKKDYSEVKGRLRSQEWFNNPHNMGMTAIYVERYTNYGWTRKELQSGKPIDGVVLTAGCDKTTPTGVMAACTMDLPAIVLSGGPMLDSWWRGRLAGSGTAV